MRRPPAMFLYVVVLAATVFAQVGDLEFCTVVGHVVDDLGRPVPGLKVEIREADSSGATASEGFGGRDDRPEESMRDFGRNSHIFAWGVSDEDGRYEIPGVRKPGAYMLVIRDNRRFHRVEAPVSIDVAVGHEFSANLIVSPIDSDPGGRKPNALLHMEAAREAEAAGDLDTAVVELTRAAHLVPESGLPNFHLARLALGEGELNRAAEEARLAASKESGCGDCRVLQALVARRQERLDEARHHAEEALILDPDLMTARSILGLVLYELNEYEQALPHLETAVRSNDPDPNAQLYLGNAYLVLRRIDSAVEAYHDYLRRFPNASNREQVERVLATLEEAPRPSNPPLSSPNSEDAGERS